MFRSGVFAIVLGLFGLLHAADKPLHFTEHLIADKYGYTFGVTAHDLDGDGDLDLTNVDIVGKRPSAASLLWWENDGKGNLTRHVMHDQEDGWLERHSVGDINGDKRPDVAVVSNRDGLVLWFEHPAEGPKARWKRHVITSKCPHAYDVVLADLDADGDLDAAVAAYVSHTLTWFENPGSQGFAEEWPRHVIDASLTENRTIRIGDFNRDGKPDLLAASVGASFMAAGESADAKTHGGQVTWFQNSGQPKELVWKKHVIDDKSRGAIHGHPVDFDFDGDLDVVMAFGMRPEHIPEDRHEIVWYENADHPDDPRSWTRHVVGKLPCAFEAFAVDIDGDKDMDIAASAWSKGDKVVVFENPGDPRSKYWTMHILKENYYAANQVIAADLDGDKRPDIIATSDDGSRRVQGANELRWWRNEGRK